MEKHVVEGDDYQANVSCEEENEVLHFITKELTNTVEKQPRNKKKANIPCSTNNDEDIEGKYKQNSNKDVWQLVYVLFQIS